MELIGILAAFGAGIAASMGLGGGFLLILYLTIISGVEQLKAQWINLLFFLPISGLALWIHLKSGLVQKEKLLPAILLGIAGALLGTFLAGFMGSIWLTRIFSIFLTFAGIRELLRK